MAMTNSKIPENFFVKERPKPFVQLYDNSIPNEKAR